MARLNKGTGNLTGILIILGIIVIILTTPQKNPDGTTAWGWSTNLPVTDSSSYSSSGSVTSSGRVSISNSPVSIGRGNASYAYQPYEEYITLENRTRNPIDITGWQLKNGKDQRKYTNSLQRFSADIAMVPQGSLYLSPNGSSALQNIVLQPGEQAILTTGSFGNRSPYKISSFKENICSGYIEALPDYAFEPALNQRCPRPSDEPGFKNLDRECQDFVRSLSSCATPDFGERLPDGEYCENCVKGTKVSNSCRTFVEAHFSYKGCIANHVSDPNFSLETWRVFLGRGWEMWGDDYETIEVFNRAGELVNFQEY